MALLDWNKGLELGVGAMDKEHQELVAAMNRIHELDRQGVDKGTVDSAIQRLVQLTKKHFADEEAHMAKIGFPDRDRHGRIHQDMLRRVAEHYTAFQQGNGRVDKAFFEFLVYWLGAHIKGIDKKYATHKVPAKV